METTPNTRRTIVIVAHTDSENHDAEAAMIQACEGITETDLGSAVHIALTAPGEFFKGVPDGEMSSFMLAAALAEQGR